MTETTGRLVGDKMPQDLVASGQLGSFIGGDAPQLARPQNGERQ